MKIFGRQIEKILNVGKFDSKNKVVVTSRQPELGAVLFLEAGQQLKIFFITKPIAAFSFMSHYHQHIHEKVHQRRFSTSETTWKQISKVYTIVKGLVMADFFIRNNPQQYLAAAVIYTWTDPVEYVYKCLEDIMDIPLSMFKLIHNDWILRKRALLFLMEFIQMFKMQKGR